MNSLRRLFSAELEGEATGIFQSDSPDSYCICSRGFGRSRCSGIFYLTFFRLIWAAIHRIEFSLGSLSGQDLLAGTVGLLIGLIIANLIGFAFARLPIIGAYGPIVFNLVFGYAGMSIAVHKKAEVPGLLAKLSLRQTIQREICKKDGKYQAVGYEFHH